MGFGSGQCHQIQGYPATFSQGLAQHQQIIGISAPAMQQHQTGVGLALCCEAKQVLVLHRSWEAAALLRRLAQD